MKSPEMSKVHLLLVRLALLFRKHTFLFGNMSLVMSARAQYLCQIRKQHLPSGVFSTLSHRPRFRRDANIWKFPQKY